MKTIGLLGRREESSGATGIPTREDAVSDKAKPVQCPCNESSAPASARNPCLTKRQKDVDSVKVLMVHGCVQNAEIFRSRTSHLRSKSLKLPGGKLDFVFAESVLPVHPGLTTPDGTETDGRSWFTPAELLQGETIRPVNSHCYLEWQKPLDELREQVNCEGPLCGVVAFSQGGIPAAILLSEHRDQMKFGIFISCFMALDEEVCKQFRASEDDPIDVPTLHVLGTTDPLVAAHRSQALANIFKDPLVATHSGGHIMIPKELFGAVKDFLGKVMKV